MSDEELDLNEYDVDSTGKVVKVERTEEPTEKPREIKGSASLIKDYQACPAKAYGRITRQPQTKGIAMSLGTAVHTTLEKFVKHQADPEKTFAKELVYEAEKEGIDIKNKEGEAAKATGIKCVSAGVAILSFTGKSGVPLFKRLDPEYIERGFLIVRNGRKYTGKIDFFAPINEWNSYVIGDWKTGKNAPKPYELDNDIQMSMYAWAAYNDPKMERTFGKWPERVNYMHLRGQSQEFHPSGKRKSASESKKPLKYDFPTKPTIDLVENHFLTRIEPVMAAMEANVWYRSDPKSCSWCGFFQEGPNGQGRCTVELPGDRLNRDDYVEYANGSTIAVKPLPADGEVRGASSTMLFDQKVIEESRRSGLKPYAEEKINGD